MFIPEKIACTIGHSILKNGNITSADGTNNGGVNEYLWCKRFVPVLVQEFRNNGVSADVIMCPERQFITSKEEMNYKLNKIHNGGYDLVIESHLNCFNAKARGTETLFSKGSIKGEEVAQRVNDKLDDIWVDRDIKARDDLYILRKTKPVSILNEYFFCDNKEDYLKADEDSELRNIAIKVVEGTLNKTIKNEQTKKYENCVLYANNIDRLGAEIISWELKDCIFKNISDHIACEGNKLFIVGGTVAEDKFKSLKTGEKYTMIGGKDRFVTIRKCLELIGK